MTDPKAIQNPEEMEAFCNLVKGLAPHSFLEIGSKYGGMLWRVAKVMPRHSRIVSVDKPKGTKAWPETHRSLELVIDRIRNDPFSHYSNLFWGDSTDPEIVKQVGLLGPFDVVFIDANHTMPYLEQDWLNYEPMATKVIAFHDIGWYRKELTGGIAIDVPMFWQQIKDRPGWKSEEIKLDPTGENNGIGVLWRQ